MGDSALEIGTQYCTSVRNSVGVIANLSIYGSSVAAANSVALHVTGLCCVNETLATAYLAHCLAIATAPIAVAANRAHLREEIDHARLGWAHLASPALTPALREQLAECVPRLLAANVPLWEQPDAFLPPGGVPDHGLPSHQAACRVAQDAVAELVLPGFQHVGVVVRRGA